MKRLLASNRAWRFVLLVLVLVVAWFALMPTPPRQLTTGWDKLNHASAFAALALAGRLAFPVGRAAGWCVAGALFAYGGLIEVVQMFVPGRESEWADLLGDGVGVGIGMLIATWLLARLRGRTATDR